MNVAGNIQTHNPLTLASKVQEACAPNEDPKTGRALGRGKRMTVFLNADGDVLVAPPWAITQKMWADSGECLGTFDDRANVMNIAYEIIAESARLGLRTPKAAA